MLIHKSRMENILQYSHPNLMIHKCGKEDKNDSEDKLEKNY